ncbi:unnamed protein product [Hymenolepis diminuta]|uniref:Uncharacterized protein n=1 Tax=Hymenolepis diminuta TaxID=6216 RepID=A0A564YNG2_HYMDI|nr:unnamed protein product [Hymenolepis diminuta]
MSSPGDNEKSPSFSAINPSLFATDAFSSFSLIRNIFFHYLKRNTAFVFGCN